MFNENITQNIIETYLRKYVQTSLILFLNNLFYNLLTTGILFQPALKSLRRPFYLIKQFFLFCRSWFLKCSTTFTSEKLPLPQSQNNFQKR